ncbi:hypothetical protein GGI25_005222 [Coemansia spiralis]|uniref:Ribosomal protein/NADH dehydrogenase domain-containing protein n=2 Tax=Coemansia TaxID=4863 RepID=A0A9W8FZ14_9FUNG|nr:hypothetical protein BX070DRAFT_230398 [Coemansia spiralis]KAJ1995620.1 hypothetical protein EDC05_000858 [Coemansia umbellata]KAJ2625049.1 hypothetical protein GGI26_000852 [Coemansia sp. RSA 1358]KAJ2672190.1 hypothetical protein GGI25_005222 [Coemansia spiralis]
MKIDRILGNLESGLGANKLSSKVQSLTLTLSQRTRASGARHFWREHLRRIQFANPNLPIHVNFPRELCTPKLDIQFTNAAVDSFSISGMKSDDICNQLLDRTKQ